MEESAYFPNEHEPANKHVAMSNRYSANNASMKALERDGWTCFVVEQRIPHTFITRDVFGFADLLCCSPTRGIMLVQVTAGSNMAARVAKVKAEPRHAIFLASGGRVQVHCWTKRAKKKERVCRILEIRKEEVS